MAALPPTWEPYAVATTSDDRRTSARSPLFTLVEVRGIGEPLWAWDIGLGGMQCRTRIPRWPGTFLDLAFTLPGSEERIEVGSQVLSLDPLDGDGLSLGLKFCMLSARDQRLIYRFLDQRRALWDVGPVDRLPAEPREKLEIGAVDRQRAFELLLLEADATLEACELQHLAIMRGVNPAQLPRLSDLMG